MGGSLIHPFGALDAPPNDRAIFREAQIDTETLAIVQRACQNIPGATGLRGRAFEHTLQIMAMVVVETARRRQLGILLLKHREAADRVSQNASHKNVGGEMGRKREP